MVQVQEDGVLHIEQGNRLSTYLRTELDKTCEKPFLKMHYLEGCQTLDYGAVKKQAQTSRHSYSPKSTRLRHIANCAGACYNKFVVYPRDYQKPLIVKEFIERRRKKQKKKQKSPQEIEGAE
ncbi:hypothetical protein CHS0354_023535 [Potamilus streckersoni]|uniref:Uncharacterized protein n=1 Tax=Potamilus streckersoni TaxID=2493646 RepID=A0AAE0RVD5_9BIVA|nr:hypothetical protein CHS0354_023535 [Potamilus streckersoni]